MLNFAFNSGIKIGSYPIEFRSFIKEKQILIDDKNKIPLIFIEEDVGFRYKSFQEENIAGILCPLFYFDIIKRDQQTKISSREFVRSIPELMKENTVREMSGYKEELYGDYVVIFARVGAYLNEMKNLGVSSKCNRVFLINIEEDIDKILKSDHINQVFMRADQLNKLKEMPKIFSVRSDGHLN